MVIGLPHERLLLGAHFFRGSVLFSFEATGRHASRSGNSVYHETMALLGKWAAKVWIRSIVRIRLR